MHFGDDIFILVCIGPIALLEFWLMENGKKWIQDWSDRAKANKPLKRRQSARSR
jgi:hypothetical protein